MATRLATAARATRAAGSGGSRVGDRIPGHIAAHSRDDAALIAVVAAGDPAALDQLFVCFRRDAFGVALTLLRDPYTAEDVVHDAFLRVWTSASTFRPERGGVKSWILAITRNAAIDRLRSIQLAQRRQSALLYVEMLAHPQDDIAAMAAMAAESRRLRAALALLPAPQ